MIDPTFWQFVNAAAWWHWASMGAAAVGVSCVVQGMKGEPITQEFIACNAVLAFVLILFVKIAGRVLG